MAYDNTPLNLNVAGIGRMPSGSGGGLVACNTTWFDKRLSCKHAGTLTEFSASILVNRTTAGANVTKAKLKIGYFDGTGTTYDKLKLRSDTDITNLVHDAVIDVVPASKRINFSIDVSSLGIEIQEGDVLGCCIETDTDTATDPEAAPCYLVCDYSTTGGGTGLIAGNSYDGDLGTTVDDYIYTGTVNSDIDDKIFFIGAKIQTTDKILYELDSVNMSGLNFIPTLDYDESYHIFLEGVTVPLGEKLEISIKSLPGGDSAYGDGHLVKYVIDYSGGAGTGTLSSYRGLTASPPATHVQSIADNEILDIDLFKHADGDSGTRGFSCMYVNYHECQGPQGITDPKHILLGDETNLTIKYSNLTSVGKLVEINNSSAATASIDKLVVAKKPVVVVGDSFTSTFRTTSPDSGAKLNHVGHAIGNAFTERRYVVNGGRTGSAVLIDSTGACTSIKDRYDSDHGFIWLYQDCIIVFVNGPGLNDIAAILDNDLSPRPEELASRVFGAISMMAGKAMFTKVVGQSDAMKHSNDVVLCGTIPYPKYSIEGVDQDIDRFNLQEEALTKLNYSLAELSTIHKIPFVDCWDFPISLYQSDWTHPSTPDGDNWIANKIATAYENNYIGGDPLDNFGNNFSGIPAGRMA